MAVVSIGCLRNNYTNFVCVLQNLPGGLHSQDNIPMAHGKLGQHVLESDDNFPYDLFFVLASWVFSWDCGEKRGLPGV